jgi:RNA polymerase sigma-70 factor (ECF subfamily)
MVPSSAVATDEELLAAWGRGEGQAGEQLLRRHFDALFRFFRHKLDEVAVVEELVQRTMTAAVAHRGRFRGDCSFRTWLFTIARHELCHELRRLPRRHEHVDVTEQSIAEISGASPTGALARQQHERLLLAALRRIPLDLQIAIELAYWEELSATDIARVLETPVGTIKSRLRRARELLQQALVALGSTLEASQATVDDLAAWAARVRDAMPQD